MSKAVLRYSKETKVGCLKSSKKQELVDLCDLINRCDKGTKSSLKSF